MAGLMDDIAQWTRAGFTDMGAPLNHIIRSLSNPKRSRR